MVTHRCNAEYSGSIKSGFKRCGFPRLSSVQKSLHPGRSLFLLATLYHYRVQGVKQKLTGDIEYFM